MGLVEDLQKILDFRSIKLENDRSFRLDFRVFDQLPGWIFRYADIDLAANLWDTHRKWVKRRSCSICEDNEMEVSSNLFCQHDGLAKKLLMVNFLQTAQNAQQSRVHRRIFLSELQNIRQYHFQDPKHKSQSTSSFALGRFLVLNTLMIFDMENMWELKGTKELAHVVEGLMKVMNGVWRGLGTQLLDIKDDQITQICIPTAIQPVFGTFLQHFQEIYHAMVDEYDDLLQCSPCLSVSHCAFHEPTMKRFSRLPLLVKDMIIEKLDGSDLATLRASSEQALYLIDTNFRSKFIDHSVYQRAVHFADSQTVQWRNEFPSRHTPEEHSHLPTHAFIRLSHLYPLHSLRGMPKSPQQLDFCLGTRVEQVEVHLRSVAEFREAMLNLFLNAEFFIFVQRLVFHADEFIFDEEMLTPPGFTVQCAKPFLMIYQRSGRQRFEMVFE